MSSYFDTFPVTVETINGKNKTLVDISYGVKAKQENYTKYDTTIVGVDEIGGASLNIYKNAESFWLILYANEYINPWIVVPEDSQTYITRNVDYSALSMRSNSGKLNPSSYLDFQAGDIIVAGANTYYVGMTSGKDLFDDNLTYLNMWYVDDYFNDNKKVKITSNLAPGETGGYQNIANPNNVPGGVYQVLRKGDTGYYLYVTPIGGVSDLKTYKYLDSPVKIESKNNSYRIASAEGLATGLDSIFTVLEDDSADAFSVIEVNQNYNIIDTEQYQKDQYIESVKIKYISQSAASAILSKLI